MSNYWVYIVVCSDRSLYSGITNDMARRLDEHNNSIKGAKYTRGRRPVDLVYLESVDSKSEALKREIVIKKKSKSAKIKLIQNRIEQSQQYANECSINLSFNPFVEQVES